MGEVRIIPDGAGWLISGDPGLVACAIRGVLARSENRGLVLTGTDSLAIRAGSASNQAPMASPSLRLTEPDDPRPWSFKAARATYSEDMQIRGNAPNYITGNAKELDRMAEMMGWRVVPDITIESVREWMLRLRSAGRKGKTIKNYRDALDRFCEWCVSKAFLPKNPVDSVPPPMVRNEPSRLIPTEEELGRIIAAGRKDWRARDWWLANAPD